MNAFHDSYREFDDTGSFDTASQAVMIYLAAFEAQDADTIATLLGDNALVEVPLLRPNRLFGMSEIRRGHLAAFNSMESAAFTETHPVAESDGTAICFGSLDLKFTNCVHHQHQAGIVAEAGEQGLRRISLYFDSRNFRRWADESIV